MPAVSHRGGVARVFVPGLLVVYSSAWMSIHSAFFFMTKNYSWKASLPTPLFPLLMILVRGTCKYFCLLFVQCDSA